MAYGHDSFLEMPELLSADEDPRDRGTRPVRRHRPHGVPAAVASSVNAGGRSQGCLCGGRAGGTGDVNTNQLDNARSASRKPLCGLGRRLCGPLRILAVLAIDHVATHARFMITPSRVLATASTWSVARSSIS